MKLNQAGIDLVKRFEGCKLEAYPDPGSVTGLPHTIGYGHTKGVGPGDKWTQKQADEQLIQDLSSVANRISTFIKQTITDNQFSALVSLAFNIGEYNFVGSTLLSLLNKGAPKEDIAYQFLRWNKNDGKVMAGLTKRREAEKALFLS